jgi:hypothetical protein
VTTDGPIDGVVVAYDDRRGLGEVVDATGRRFPFHAMQIADGSRAISPGTPVRFVVVPGHLGRWEAGAVQPSTASATST